MPGEQVDGDVDQALPGVGRTGRLNRDGLHTLRPYRRVLADRKAGGTPPA
jgi:hypothetical protein